MIRNGRFFGPPFGMGVSSRNNGNTFPLPRVARVILMGGLQICQNASPSFADWNSRSKAENSSVVPTGEISGDFGAFTPILPT
jgi:hypothetical protein